MIVLLGKSRKDKKFQFKAGDFVRVRSAEIISQTFDNFSKLDGCLFMNQMWQYCEQKFKVSKVVKNFFDEHRYKMYKTRAPLYILGGIICNGITEAFDYRCDRSCYLLWHEEWLEKP